MTRIATTAVLAGWLGIAVMLGGSRAAASSATSSAAVPATTTSAAARSSATDAAPPPTIVVYEAPVHGAPQVLRRFDPPATQYGRGHLGVDLALSSGGPVLAAGAGVVRFAGPVAGRGVVVVEHADGVRTEYEPIRPSVRVGNIVRRGQELGVLDGVHRGCAQSCLHWGARRDGHYLDPLLLLRPLGPVRLLPWPRDG